MKKYFTIRNRTHYFEPASDKNYRINTAKGKFKKWWIDEMSLTLALMLPGADPIAVCDPKSIFHRAAADIWFYMRDDTSHKYWSVRSHPIYGDGFLMLTYIRSTDHRPEFFIYKPNETTIITSSLAYETNLY